MDKYINTNGFDMNSFDADRVAAREEQEKAKQNYRPISDELMAAYDAGENRKREERKAEQRRQEKLEEIEIQEARYRMEDWKREQERIKARANILKKQEEAKEAAIDLARERYLEKSGLYRLFHKRLSAKKASKMTTSQINNLYGGIEENKGRSK